MKEGDAWEAHDVQCATACLVVHAVACGCLAILLAKQPHVMPCATGACVFFACFGMNCTLARPSQGS